MTNKQKGTKTRDWLKIAISVTAILAGLAYTGNAWLTYSRGIQGENDREWGGERFRGGRGERPPGPRTEEEREERIELMANQLDLSPEQQNQITQLWQAGRPEGADGGRGRFERMQEILTPQQQEQFQQMRQSRGQQFMDRRLEEAKRKLPPDEYKKFERLMKERGEQSGRGRRGGGRGGGGGGGGGGGRGGGRGGGGGGRGSRGS